MLAGCTLASSFDGLTGGKHESGDPVSAPPAGGDQSPAGNGTVSELNAPTWRSLGDGKDGSLSLASGERRVVNECAAVAAIAAEGVDVASFGAHPEGRVLLIHQIGADMPGNAPVGSESKLGAVGMAQLVRLKGIRANMGSVTLLTGTPVADALLRKGAASANVRTQVCTIPEYSDVSVPPGATLEAEQVGDFGGIVAFLANDTVTIDGVVDASGAGFSGGIPSGNVDAMNVTAANVDCKTGMAGHKGASFDTRSRGLCGRGAYLNAGGGGNAHNAGGGGGALGGTGGSGGKEDSGRGAMALTAGEGGAALAFLGQTDRVIFGGGGGAGHQNDGVGGPGGAGGGFVWIAAQELAGRGAIASDGRAGGDSGTSPGGFPDSGGGGGSGGVITIAAQVSTFEGQVHARGGPGGGVQDDGDVLNGPGGGGGGGIVRVLGQPIANVDVAGGAAGVFVGVTVSSSHGATAGGAGVVVGP